MLETTPRLHRFLGVQPRAFGAVLVVLGLLHVAFGILFIHSECSYTDSVGIHFFSGILLFLAGIISIIADRHPSIGMVKACLVFQIMAAAVAAVISFLYIRDILYYFHDFCTLPDQVNNCRVRDQILLYCRGMRGIAFLTGIVSICLTISLAAFSCKAICYRNSEDTEIDRHYLGEVMVIISDVSCFARTTEKAQKYVTLKTKLDIPLSLPSIKKMVR